MTKKTTMKRIAIISALFMSVQLSLTPPVNYGLKQQGIKNLNSLLSSKTAYAADTDYLWNNVIPEKSPAAGKSNGKLVLFDNSHGETAGQADWVIDGGFSDFADDLVNHGYTVREYRGVDKNGDGTIRYFDDRKAENVEKNEAIISYEAIKDADVFVIAEANRPLTLSERAALKKFVDDGKGIYFIADHYNADRNMNTWDATEVFNGYNRSSKDEYNMGGSYGDLRNPKVEDKGWLAENFGVRFRFNAIDLISGVSDVKTASETEGLTNGVKPILMAAGSTLAILDGNKAKGLVYFSAKDKPKPWGNAADKGLYFGGAKEGAYVAISKPSKGKAAFIGDSSPIEDITTKYKNEGNGNKKKTHNGYKDKGNAAALSVNIVDWLANTENYSGFDGVAHTKGIKTPEPMIDIEKDEADPEPWSTPSYDPWNTDTFAEGSYNAPQGPMTNVIKVTGVTLDQNSVILNPNKNATLVATVAPANATSKTVKWSSSNENVVTISNGIITGKAVGDAIITVTTVDGKKTATCNIKVTNDSIAKVEVTGVTLSKSTFNINIGNVSEISAAIMPTNATEKGITWESSNTAVATVDKGIVTAKAKGSTIIKVTTVDGKKTASCTVNVTQTVGPILSEGFDSVGGSKTSPISKLPEGWSKDSSLYAYSTTSNFGNAAPSIGFKGNVELKTPVFSLPEQATLSFWLKGNPGSGDIGTLSIEKFDGTNWTSIEKIEMEAKEAEVKSYKLEKNIAQIKFNYIKKTSNILLDDVKIIADAPSVVNPTSISLDKAKLKLNKGETTNLVANVLPENSNNKNVIWSSSDEKVATVNDGVVTAVASGKATIIATTEAGTIKANCEVEVIEVKVESVKLKEVGTIYVGETVALVKEISSSNAIVKEATWASSNEKVATVDKNTGKVTAVGVGKATITVNVDGKTAIVEVNVEAKVESVKLKEVGTIYVGETSDLVKEITPSNATVKEITWTTSNKEVATVKAGKVTAIGAGKATITVTVDGKIATVEVSVKAKEDTKPVDPVKPVDPNKPVDPVKPVEPTKPTEKIKPEYKENVNNGIREITISKIDNKDAVNVVEAKVDSNIKDAVVEITDLEAIKEGKGSLQVTLGNTVINLPFNTIDKDLLVQGAKIILKNKVVDNTDITKNLKGVKKAYNFDLVVKNEDKEIAIHNFKDGIAEVIITLSDDELKGLNKDKLTVFYYNESTKAFEIMETKVEGNKVTFKTAHFSQYVIAEKQEVSKIGIGIGSGDELSKTVSDGEILKTGSKINTLTLTLGAFALIGIGVVVIIRRKQKS